jgi:glycosyltransferase involved in cell wall biosynthesis
MVLMAHNINPFSKLREQIWSRKQLLRMAVHRGVIRAVARRANKVVFVSEWSRQEMSSALAIPLEKTSVVYHGVDGIFKSRPKQTALENRVRYILAVSEVLEHKNFERLIETFIRLCKSLDEEVHLLIAGRIGSESLRRSLEERLTRESMIDRVKFLGFVSGEELAALYRQAELLVFPSVEETFGFPLIEAMASGLPVVTSNRSAMPEICGDAAQYFDPLDIDDMTQTIERVLIDPSLRDSLTKRGLKRSEEFSWIKSANSLLSILNSAASVTEPIRCES